MTAAKTSNQNRLLSLPEEPRVPPLLAPLDPVPAVTVAPIAEILLYKNIKKVYTIAQNKTGRPRFAGLAQTRPCRDERAGIDGGWKCRRFKAADTDFPAGLQPLSLRDKRR
jgi:hypothetical protein